MRHNRRTLSDDEMARIQTAILKALTDLNMTGNASKVIAVNAGATALEFVTAGGGGGLSQQQVEGLI